MRDGILHVSAREHRSGKEAEVEVKPTYGLTDQQVERTMVPRFCSITRRTDMQERQQITRRKNQARDDSDCGEEGQEPCCVAEC